MINLFSVLHVREFPGKPSAVADARGYVRDFVCGLAGEGEASETAELLTSEVVTNAVRHSRSLGGTVTVIVARSDGAVRVEVIDGGGTTSTPNVNGEPYAEEGRGLFLVDRLASRWGTHADAAGRTTWFEIRAEL